MKAELSRRTAIKSLFIGLGAAATGGGIYEGVRRLDRDRALGWLETPEDYQFLIAGRPPPQTLQGVHMNSPFLYLASDEDIAHHLEHVNKPWIKGLRVFLNDEVEPVLGVHNTAVLERVSNLAHRLEEMGKMIQIDLFDGYTMQKTWNPIFGGHDATSPYAANGAAALYTDQPLLDAFFNRIEVVSSALRKLPNLASVSVANELHPPDHSEGSEVFTAWYQTVVGAIVSAFPRTPVLSGVGDPRVLGDIDGLAATTVHIYPWTNTLNWINSFMRSSKLPVVVQECGAPHSLFDIRSPLPNDTHLSDYLRDVLYKTTTVNTGTRTVTLTANTLYPWKVDNYVDGFSFNPADDQESARILETFNGILDRIAA